MLYILLAELNTIDCNSEKIEELISHYAQSYIKVTDGIFIFKKDRDYDSFDAIQNTVLDMFYDYTNEKTCLFVIPYDNCKAAIELPDDAVNYLLTNVQDE